MKLATLCLILLLAKCSSGTSQYVVKLDLLRIDNKVILSENYPMIKLPEEIARGEKWNIYNPNNPDTFLEILQDQNHTRFHILIQTDFFGNVQYLAASSNLISIISKKTIPKFSFDHCIQSLNDGYAHQQENIINVINCIVERMEACLQK